MHNNSTAQKSIGQWLAAVFSGGAALFFIIFLAQASSLSSTTETTKRIVGLGPLHFLQITKSIDGAGTSASFEFLPGIMGYIIVLALLTGAGVWYSLRRTQTVSAE